MKHVEVPRVRRRSEDLLDGDVLLLDVQAFDVGAVGSCLDNALRESFFGSMQIELLDRRNWHAREELASAIFEWIEAFYNPIRRHSALVCLSPFVHERRHTAVDAAA